MRSFEDKQPEVNPKTNKVLLVIAELDNPLRKHIANQLKSLLINKVIYLDKDADYDARTDKLKNAEDPKFAALKHADRIEILAHGYPCSDMLGTHRDNSNPNNRGFRGFFVSQIAELIDLSDKAKTERSYSSSKEPLEVEVTACNAGVGTSKEASFATRLRDELEKNGNNNCKLKAYKTNVLIDGSGTKRFIGENTSLISKLNHFCLTIPYFGNFLIGTLQVFIGRFESLFTKEKTLKEVVVYLPPKSPIQYSNDRPTVSLSQNSPSSVPKQIDRQLISSQQTFQQSIARSGSAFFESNRRLDLSPKTNRSMPPTTLRF